MGGEGGASFHWARNADIAGMRSGRSYLVAASIAVSHSEGLVARWKVVVVVANVWKGFGEWGLEPWRRAEEIAK